MLGFDLVRNEFGDWRVLEDNARSPSGALYAIAVRELLDEVMPDMPRPPGLVDARQAGPDDQTSRPRSGGPRRRSVLC